MKKPTTTSIWSSTLGILLILGIAIALNALVASFGNIRKDMTEEKLYTLSDSTITLLNNMERDVTFKLYFSHSIENLPIAIKQYAQRIEDLLGEYVQHSAGKIERETYNPKPYSDEEEWARKYGVTPQTLNFLRGDNLYLGVVAVSGATDKAIPFLAPGAEPQLEYLLTRLIVEATQPSRPQLGILSSLPVMGVTPPRMPYGMQQQQQAQPPWVVINELQRQYDLTEIPETTPDIPENIDTLLLIHPKNLSDTTLFAIDQFILRGGRLMAFMDALSLTDMQNQPPPNMMNMGRSIDTASDLNKLTTTWGYTLTANKLIGDPQLATEISGPQGQPERSLPWLSLRDQSINRQEIATESLDFVMTPFSGILEGSPAEGLTATTLLNASEKAGLLDAMLAMNGRANDADLSPASNATIAVRLQGTFKTAFPAGPPPPETKEGQEATQPTPNTPGSWLTESTGSPLVMLIADVDMMYDRFMVRKMNMMGQVIAEPINDNLNFILNSVETMSGNEALIGLRSRGRYERPFDKVNDLQQIATKRYQKEEEAFQTELQKAQQRLDELQRGKSADQKTIVSPEQQNEIKKLQDEVFKTQRKLREVKKNLNKDIEQLGLKLKAINIAAIPLLIALFGITRGLRRKRQATHTGS